MADLRELRDRVAKLTGPDREVDCLVWAEMDGRDVRWDANMLLARSRRPPHDECMLGDIDPGRVARNFTVASGHRPSVPAYTSSVDAVLSLIAKVMPDLWWIVRKGAPGEPEAYLGNVGTFPVTGTSPTWPRWMPTPALALLLALLEAKSTPSSEP